MLSEVSSLQFGFFQIWFCNFTRTSWGILIQSLFLFFIFRLGHGPDTIWVQSIFGNCFDYIFGKMTTGDSRIHEESKKRLLCILFHIGGRLYAENRNKLIRAMAFISNWFIFVREISDGSDQRALGITLFTAVKHRNNGKRRCYIAC